MTLKSLCTAVYSGDDVTSSFSPLVASVGSGHIVSLVVVVGLVVVGSQCSSDWSSWDKPRTNFRVPLTTRAAELSTRWNLSVSWVCVEYTAYRLYYLACNNNVNSFRFHYRQSLQLIEADRLFGRRRWLAIGFFKAIDSFDI